MAFEITRRIFLVGGIAYSIGACETLSDLSAPGYLYYKGKRADFNEHLNSEGNRGKFVLGGIDGHFKDGAPVVATGKEIIIEASYSSTAGNYLVSDYGIVQKTKAHMKELFKRVGDMVDRATVVGTEGGTGSDAAVVHLHETVVGNAVFHHHNYNERFKGNQSKYNYVLDPDRLTPDPNRDSSIRRSLYEFPWDLKTDYDTPYLHQVEQIKEEFQRLARDFPNSQISLDIKIALGGRHGKPGTLVDTINWTWQTYEKTKHERGPLIKGLEEVYDNVREAGKLIKLTSPFIDHTNPETILAVANANPEYIKKSILDPRYYGQFLPPEMRAKFTL